MCSLRILHATYFIIAICSPIIPELVEGSDRWDLPYSGTKYSEDEVHVIRREVQEVIPDAKSQAESLTGLRIDNSLLEMRLDEAPVGLAKRLYKMQTYGKSLQTISIRIEPFLRGEYVDDGAVLQVLTHEMIHVATRQFMGHELYSSIPEWWQEGAASELSGQRQDRLWQYLAEEWRDPFGVMSDISIEYSERPYLVGSYLAHAILGQVQGGYAKFVDVLAGSGSIEKALEILKLDPREIEDIAKTKMMDEISASQKGVFESYQKGKFLYRKWRDSPKEERISGDEFRDIMEMLVTEHPNTYAGEVANYWLGKYYFHLGMTKEAFESFDRFAELPRHYGLLDDSWYYRILLLMHREKSPEVVGWCEKYLRLFPDGNHWKKVAKICGY